MSARVRPGFAFAVVGAIVLSSGAMLAMQQDTKKKEGPASIYKQNAKPGQSDLSLKSSDVNEVVEGKVRGNEVPTQVQK